MNLLSLPDELLVLLFDKITNPRSFWNLAACCKHLKQVSSDESLFLLCIFMGLNSIRSEHPANQS